MSKYIPYPMFYDDVPLDISFALEQDIPAGTQVEAGTTVQLEFKDTKAAD